MQRGRARFLIDTSTFSLAIAPRPHVPVVEQLAAHQHELATGTPVIHEMEFGYLRLPTSARRRTIEDYVTGILRSDVPVLPYDLAAARWHAAERARLVAVGRTPPHIDSQIAAIAATNGLILVTANVSDFQHFAGLRVEDWRV